MGASVGALDGIRVLDLGQLVQGPQAAQMLQDLGADVIKIELPGVGDLARRLPISLEDLRAPFFEGCNRGKRGVCIDLRTAQGMHVFLDLVKQSDVVISNFVHGTMEGWGLGYDVMSARNPGIVWGSGTTFGSVGPDALQKGADLAGQAAGGLLSVVGGQDHLPVGVTIADHIGSQNLSNGVLAALVSRSTTGLGQQVEVSLYGGIIYAQASELTRHFLSGELKPPEAGGHPIVPSIYGVFPTSDGHVAVIGVPEEVMSEFFELLGAPELVDDPRRTAVAFIQGGRAEFIGVLNVLTANQTTEALESGFRRIGVRYAPVRDYAGVAADLGAVENGYLHEVDHPVWGDTMTVGSPIRMSRTPATPGSIAPALGEHTDEVLAEIGYDADRIEALRATGVV